MDEFTIIDRFFRSLTSEREDVYLGIGDDAASLHVPHGMDLLVSTDTLVAEVHFLSQWDAYDVASRAVRVIASDIAAMGGTPTWLTLALTIPGFDLNWLQRFSLGLADRLQAYGIALVGGNMARGSLSITGTIHGLVSHGRAVTRRGARVGDKIYVSGLLGAAAQAVAWLKQTGIADTFRTQAMDKLLRPVPRFDLVPMLQDFATAAIDVSDGLLADLSHIAQASQCGACIQLDHIPVHPLLQTVQGDQALDVALCGGDDYEICFTVSAQDEQALLKLLVNQGITGYCIGEIESAPGLRGRNSSGDVVELTPKGYRHFEGVI